MKGQKKGFKHTEETKKIISEHSKNFWKNPEYVKKVLETRKRRREKLGYINSPSARKKSSEAMKKRYKEGKFNPKDISPFIKGHRIRLGMKHSKETKEKMRKSNKGISEKTKMGQKEWRKNYVFPKKDTSIEIKIQNFLKQLGIEFFTPQYMNIKHGYQCDFFIPSLNLVVETDGDYWHKYPVGNDIDHIRTKELIEKGFKVLRLWEFEIKNMKLNDFKKKIKGTD